MIEYHLELYTHHQNIRLILSKISISVVPLMGTKPLISSVNIIY